MFLDMSAMVVPESDKNDFPISKDTLDKQTQRFIKRFHSLDLDNWLFGSDWVPHENDLEPQYYLNELVKTGFKEQEIKQIISNRLDFIE